MLFSWSFLFLWVPMGYTLQEQLPLPLLPSNEKKSPIVNDTATNPTLLVDTFKDRYRNDLGYWHGPTKDLTTEYGDGFVSLYPSDPDQNYNTQLSSATCFNLQWYRGQYLHVIFAGTRKFGISLNQHNRECDSARSPYPETWDTIEAERYAKGNDIYVPLEHFVVDQSRAVSVSFGGFYSSESLTLFKVEIVSVVPPGWLSLLPPKLDNGRIFQRCTRPGSFAFGIDDGIPAYVQEVMEILKEERILVTFFVVGAGLREKETNLSQAYGEMLRRGHQIALHSTTHQKMEGFQTTEAIDNEIIQNIEILKYTLGIETRYFRPPYGTVGARTRQRLAAYIEDPQIINWSVDVEDWRWASSKFPEKQKDAFFRDVARGGNLAVMHYLSPTTIRYFREFIRFIKTMGLNIMRVDQCLEDPNSPPLINAPRR